MRENYNVKCFSYGVLIAEVRGSKLYVNPRCIGYSNTTSRHLRKFTGMGKKEIEAKMASKEIKCLRQ